jgi:hypothetical protein
MVLAQKADIKTSGREDPDMNPHNYANLSLTRHQKHDDGEKTASSTNVAGKSGHLPAEN